MNIHKITIINDEQESYYTHLWFSKGIGIIKIDREMSIHQTAVVFLFVGQTTITL